MVLLFNNFGVRRIELEAAIWPGFGHGFKPGQLSRLYGHLNGHDLFESCDLRANVGAEFESENWNFDISTTRIRVRSEAFQTFPELEREMTHLLSEAREFFDPEPYLIPEHIAVRGVIPDDSDKSVNDVVVSKLLGRRLSKVDTAGDRLLDLLPGQLSGTGVELVGDTDEFHWHASIGPGHSMPVLPISADLYFSFPKDPPDSALISDRLTAAYDFVVEGVVEFAKAIFR